MESTWYEREVPILRAFYDAEEAGAPQLYSGDIASATGLDEGTVLRAVRALTDAGYIAPWKAGQLTGSLIYYFPRLAEKGRREIGQWPASSFDAFVAVLQQRISEETEPETKSGLVRLRDALLGIGRDVAVDVLGAALKHAGGI